MPALGDYEYMRAWWHEREDLARQGWEPVAGRTCPSVSGELFGSDYGDVVYRRSCEEGSRDQPVGR